MLAENQFLQQRFFLNSLTLQSKSFDKQVWNTSFQYFYALWLARLTFQSSESNPTDCSSLPSFHSCTVLGPQTENPHRSWRRTASFPFAPPFKKYQFCTVPLSGMS